jgi:CheY-like chemotaxis protein
MQSHPANFDFDCLVSKAIMNAHGGQLWVTSTGVPGEGCMFGMEMKVASVQSPLEVNSTVRPSVSDPYCARQPTLDYATVEDMPVAVAPDFQFDLLHALVVDDSPMNRKMLMLQLKAIGLTHVTQACNGLEAVQAVEERLNVESDQKLFDVIFMDCMMPVMGGNEATRKLRELGYDGTILTVTGNGMPEEIKEIMSCGSTKVLLKPVKANQVEAAIQGEWSLIHGAICVYPHLLTHHC